MFTIAGGNCFLEVVQRHALCRQRIVDNALGQALVRVFPALFREHVLCLDLVPDE